MISAHFLFSVFRTLPVATVNPSKAGSEDAISWAHGVFFTNSCTEWKMKVLLRYSQANFVCV